MTTKEMQREYDNWLSMRPVNWQAFKNEEYYAQNLEDQFIEEYMIRKHELKESD